MDTNEKIIFEVVGCGEQTKNLLEKELYTVKRMNSATGSVILKLKEVGNDESEEYFFFEQKDVLFTSTDVYCNGFLSDDKKTVGTIQLKFKPRVYCCP
tara:strand:- start:252 stop:545 length:294 start_codon:yes stop_codon:yes gene_type:complete